MKSVILLVGLAVAFVACASSSAESNGAKGGDEKTGKELYRKNCVLCHGSKGDRGASGASDLIISVLSRDEIIDVITNGREQMAPFGKKLTAAEIERVTDHVESLKGP